MGSHSNSHSNSHSYATAPHGQLLCQSANDYYIGLSVISLFSKVFSLGMIMNGILTIIKYLRGFKGIDNVVGTTTLVTKLLTRIPFGVGALYAAPRHSSIIICIWFI